VCTKQYRLNSKSGSLHYPRLCMQQKTQVSCNSECLCTSYKYTDIKSCHNISILILHTTILLNLKIALLKKNVCFTLQCNMSYYHSKIPLCVSQDILIRNHILIFNKIIREHTHLFTWLQEPFGFKLYKTWYFSCYTLLTLLISMLIYRMLSLTKQV
jgi:hypothetical protein